MNRAVSGAGGVLKQGAGTVFVTAANSYLGGTAITGGTLNANADTAFGGAAGTVALSNGAVLQAGGPLTMNRAFALGTGGGTIDTNGSTVTLGATSAISGTSLTKAGGGILNITGAQTYAALTTTGGVTNLMTDFGDGLPFTGEPEKLGAPALVPEPGALGLLMVGALGVLGRRRP